MPPATRVRELTGIDETETHSTGARVTGLRLEAELRFAEAADPAVVGLTETLLFGASGNTVPAGWVWQEQKDRKCGDAEAEHRPRPCRSSDGGKEPADHR